MHTPEPWTYSYTSAAQARRESVDEDGIWDGTDGGGASGFIYGRVRSRGSSTSDVLAFLPHHRDPAEDEERGDNAKRIVACVNGCKGIVDPETTVPDLVAALALVAATSHTTSSAKTVYLIPYAQMEDIKTLLTKLEGGAK